MVLRYDVMLVPASIALQLLSFNLWTCSLAVEGRYNREHCAEVPIWETEIETVRVFLFLSLEKRCSMHAPYPSPGQSCVRPIFIVVTE